MRIHILGICGTFMAGIAVLAKQAGYDVEGSDLAVYPPMSTQLEEQGIKLYNGYDSNNISPDIDVVIVGNVIKRGNPAIEYVLNENIPYVSGPEWLAKNILSDRWVLAVSGTHGKTTTTSMLAWILEYAGLQPGFLVGGIPENFGLSARIGQSPYFVIEADEYDSAFFDKRSKFIHYHPKTLILNNLEYDHADIFPNLEAIKQQFHYLIRTVPSNGCIIKNNSDPHLSSVLEKGRWTPIATFADENADWQSTLIKTDGSEFTVSYQNKVFGQVTWELVGNHNVNNALAAIAAANHAGVKAEIAIQALSSFKNVKRRLEVKGTVNGITVYDDFAHHPTAIATTLAGLRAKIGKSRLIAVLEFGSFTMRSGVHRDQLPQALHMANLVFCKKPELNEWGLAGIAEQCVQTMHVVSTVEGLIEELVKECKAGDHVLIMSNSGFGGLHQKLLEQL